MSRRRGAMLVGAAVLAGAAAGLGAAAARSMHRRRHASGPTAPGGRLMNGAAGYDLASRFLFAPLFRRIAVEVAALAPPGAAVVDVGCGPGHLAIRLARERGLRVTACDLDPAMVARADANAARGFAPGDPGRPAFLVGDVAALPFPDQTFDLAVSTFSLHHWADPAAGLRELHRVLRPGGRALIWDVVAPLRRLEGHEVDLTALAAASPFGVVRLAAWRWPGPVRFAERLELVRAPATESPAT